MAPRPGTDGALALGLAHVIVAEGLHDEAWLAAHTVGWPELRARIADFPPPRVAAICGLPVEDVVRLARLYARGYGSGAVARSSPQDYFAQSLALYCRERQRLNVADPQSDRWRRSTLWDDSFWQAKG